MRKLLVCFLSLMLLIFCTSCAKDETSVLNVDVIEELDTTYGEKAQSSALEFLNYKDTNLGFSLVGSDADTKKAEYIYNYFNEIGLSNVSYVPIKTDGWKLSNLKLVYPCTCVEEGYYTYSKMGFYPCDVELENEDIEFVYLKDELSELDGEDLNGKGVLVEKSENIVDVVKQLINSGVAAVICKTSNAYSDLAIDVNLYNGMPTDIPVFTLSSVSFSAIVKEIKNFPDGFYINLSVSSKLLPNIESNFVVGEIEGKDKDNVIYVIANRDTYFQGFQSSCVNLGELFRIAEGLISEKYVPKNTIKFVAATASEWGSIENNIRDIGLKEFLRNSNDNIKSIVYLKDGALLKDVVFTETKVSENMQNTVESFNNNFNSKKYLVVNNVKLLEEQENDDLVYLNEYTDNVVIEAEYKESNYNIIRGTSLDDASLGTDNNGALFVIDFYTSLLKELDKTV